MEQANGIITLTTDFGDADGFVGAMKGVVLSRFSQAHLVDIAHELPRQDVLAAAMVLYRACLQFPRGTVHLAVVDPGVGSDRAGIIAETRDHLFVLPDNGLLTLIARTQNILRIHRLEDPSYRLSEVSNTFHGRDIFAPAAAHAAAGVRPQKFGPELTDPVMVHWPECRQEGYRITGEIVAVDVYGNLTTNIPNSALSNGSWRLQLGEWTLFGPIGTYSEVDVGAPLFLHGSMGWVEIAIREGDAAQKMKVAAGVEVTIERVSH